MENQVHHQDTPPVRLLAQVRDRLRVKHYAIGTETRAVGLAEPAKRNGLAFTIRHPFQNRHTYPAFIQRGCPNLPVNRRVRPFDLSLDIAILRRIDVDVTHTLLQVLFIAVFLLLRSV